MINLKQLLTENTAPREKIMEAADHVRSGLEKVFAAGDVEISYRRCENVGLGYIKSISEAMKVANTEARVLAKTFGYRADDSKKIFIKEDNNFGSLDAQSPEGALAKQTSDEQPHDERDMSNPEEKSEVEIGKEILAVIEEHLSHDLHSYHAEGVQKIKALAEKLVQMHGAK
jgi:hypothetical protein